MKSPVVKTVLVVAILCAAAFGATPVLGVPRLSLAWLVGILAFGIFNAVVWAPGTAWVRSISILATISTLLWGRVETFALLAWIAWPPAYVVSWALAPGATQAVTEALEENSGDVFTTPRIQLAVLVIALAVASIAYKIMFAHGLHQTSALFIGIPALLAVVVVFSVSPSSVAGLACKAVTIGLLMSMLFLGEGMVCVIMAAPLFYAVAVGIATALEWTVRDKNKPMTLRSCLILLPLIPMSLEGVTGATSFNRQETVVASKIIEARAADVDRAVFALPRFGRTLPFYLRAGFPTPTATRIDLSLIHI